MQILFWTGDQQGSQLPCQTLSREASAAPAASLCAGHAQQLGGGSPPPNLMEVKG